MTLISSARSRGFTLVEMIVYVAILSVVAVLATNVTLAMTRAFTDLRVSRDLNSSATVLFERLTRDIRSANGIDVAQSTFNVSPGRLTLNTKDSLGANTTIEFYVENGLIKMNEGGIAQGAIMTASTRIDSFVVRQLLNANTAAVTVEATISATRGDITQTRNFYTTVVLRGTY
ncbi:MAG: prepilin-type N-terminal cleavage/methylation domain-containing protein [Minisyncoccota bacterium]